MNMVVINRDCGDNALKTCGACEPLRFIEREYLCTPRLAHSRIPLSLSSSYSNKRDIYSNKRGDSNARMKNMIVTCGNDKIFGFCISDF